MQNDIFNTIKSRILHNFSLKNSHDMGFKIWFQHKKRTIMDKKKEN